ncbi:MAG: HAD family hydrolase [Christensenellales bacterium]|jgi:hydroxymethylpyrimidine pyrophosphatase-like HAD family hydrolase
MKTFYITDLDGTFLGKDARPSAFSIQGLELLHGRGVAFTVASARMPSSVAEIMAGAGISVPAVLLNGAVIYDLKAARCCKVEYIAPASCALARDILRKHGLRGGSYLIQSGGITVTAEGPFAPLSEESRGSCFYMKIAGTCEGLIGAFEEARQVPGLSALLYGSVYSTQRYYLEVFSAKASKQSGVQWLKDQYGYDRVVGFGDNLNDLPLLQACDVFYAVENALDELKAAASAVIGPHDHDAVIKQILTLEGLL